MDPLQRFHDRREAGQLLACHLAPNKDRDGVVVLALPHGRVPVGYELLNGDVVSAYNIPLHVVRVNVQQEGSA